MIRPTILILTIALGACVAGEPAAPPPSALAEGNVRGSDDTETAAMLLAIAAADPASDRHREAVAALRTMGLRALDGEADVVGDWSARLPADTLPPMRGRLLGPGYRSGMLAPGKRIETAQVFEGGRAARVSLSGAGQRPLALTVADSKANPVCQTAPGNPRNCRWTPAFSGRYAIAVENTGTSAVQYFLVIG